MSILRIYLILLIVSIALASCSNSKNSEIKIMKYHDLDLSIIDSNDFLIAKSSDNQNYELGRPFTYMNQSGDIIIPLNKYYATMTDTFISFAIVMKDSLPWIGIDRNENILYEIFYFDNGPDYIVEGLFRVQRNGKIGYANEQGEIVIPCQFDCAYYFENGKAKVSKDCKKIQDMEYQKWESDAWYYIDKNGNRIE